MSFGRWLAQKGRGAIVVDTVTQPPDAPGHPFGYVLQTSIEQDEDEDTKRLVREYDPYQEFVIKLLKPENRTSTYRVRPLPRGTNKGRTS